MKEEIQVRIERIYGYDSYELYLWMRNPDGTIQSITITGEGKLLIHDRAPGQSELKSALCFVGPEGHELMARLLEELEKATGTKSTLREELALVRRAHLEDLRYVLRTRRALREEVEG